VGSVRELLADPAVGTIVPRRDAPSVAAAIEASLARSWDRARTSAAARARSWEVVGREVAEEIAAALAARRAAPEGLGQAAEALP
jgi:hypothetical protein